MLLTRPLFIIKGCNSGAAKWKRFIRQGLWEVHRASGPSPGKPFSLYLQMFTTLLVFIEASLYSHG